jgi:hypothetical protein
MNHIDDARVAEIPDWLAGTTHKDWLFDGRRCTPEQWASLDWSKAYVDLGPSIAGNLGPYWHVPDLDGDCTHRLYPKMLQGKWLNVIRQAIEEHAARAIASLQAREQKPVAWALVADEDSETYVSMVFWTEDEAKAYRGECALITPAVVPLYRDPPPDKRDAALRLALPLLEAMDGHWESQFPGPVRAAIKAIRDVIGEDG